MVVIFLPATLAMGVTQERAAAPSICTVQAPHSAMPHPNFVPVMFSVSRNTHSSGISGATSTVCGLPFSTKLMAMIPPCGKSAVKQNTSRRREYPTTILTIQGAALKLLWRRLGVRGLGCGFILDREQLHFKYQRGVRTDIGPRAAVPIGKISGNEQLPF
jgi:hypothetical protein